MAIKAMPPETIMPHSIGMEILNCRCSIFRRSNGVESLDRVKQADAKQMHAIAAAETVAMDFSDGCIALGSDSIRLRAQ